MKPEDSDEPPPLPPFTQETATQKVRVVEDARNLRNPAREVLADAIYSRWQNRAEFPSRQQEIQAFLTRKRVRELDYRLVKEFWTCARDRIAVRFAYQYHDDRGHWFRASQQRELALRRRRPHDPTLR